MGLLKDGQGKKGNSMILVEPITRGTGSLVRTTLR